MVALRSGRGTRHTPRAPEVDAEKNVRPDEEDRAALEILTGTRTPPVPYYILVDEHGKIVRSSPQVALDDLPPLLDRLVE